MRVTDANLVSTLVASPQVIASVADVAYPPALSRNLPPAAKLRLLGAVKVMLEILRPISAV